MKPDIFLSYNREDKETAQSFAQAFETQGFSVWWDVTLRSGDAYDKVTEAALRGAKAVVVLWSPRSVDSRWVRAEATIADRNGTLLPVTIEPCERPVMFELTQTAELSHWKGVADDKEWLAFLDDVRRMVEREQLQPRVATPAAAPGLTGWGASTVVVLPITHRAGEGGLEFLGEDLTEEITRELAQNPFIKVIAAGAMAAWRGKQIDYRALGRELEARYLIEARLQRADETIRLTVQLIDTATGSMLWSTRVLRKTAEIDAAPEEFPIAVASQLGEQIIQIDMSRAMTKPGPFSGWEYMLRSMAYGARLGSESARRAIEEVRKAVVAAPDLGLAHASLAAQLPVQLAEGKELDNAQRREIQTHIQRAMQLDGDNPIVITRAVAAYAGLGDGETALRLARRAVELYPNSPRSHFVLGIAYVELGRTADAIAAHTQQHCLTSVDSNRYIGLANLGMCYLLEGKLEEAEAAIDRALALHPNYYYSLKWKAIVAAYRGKESAALAAIMRLREVEPTMSINHHVWQIERNRNLTERSAEAIATLRRLWGATEGDA